MGISVKLEKNDLKYAKRIFELSTEPGVKNALGLKTEKIEETIDFLTYMLKEEQAGNVISRVILNERDEVIGHTGLKNLRKEEGICHIGTWIGVQYWGMGYNQLAKIELLKIAFTELNMEYVIAGAKKSNLRSINAQKKLPYVTFNVEKDFPNDLEIIEAIAGEECILTMIKKQDFISFLEKSN